MSLREIKDGAIHLQKFGLPVMYRHDYEKGRDKRLEQYIEQSVCFAADCFRGRKTEKDISKKSLIDIGCADGYAVKRFIELGFKTSFGIDLYPNRKNYPEIKDSLIDMDFYNLDHRINKREEVGPIDYVFCNHTLEHAENAFELAYQINLITQKDSMIFVAVPNGNYEWAWDLRDSTTHFSCFTPNFLESMFSRFGWETIHLDGEVELEPKRDNNRKEIWYVGQKK